MKVCIDVQSAVTQRAGVGRYTKLLVQHLGPKAGQDELSLFYFDFKRKGIPFNTTDTVNRSVRWCPGRIAQLAWKTIHWPPANFFAGPADLYHFPNFILPPLSKGKSVVSIHDVSFLRLPDFAEERNRLYLSACIKDTVSRADAIITDSNFSAEEISTLLHVNPDRIFPIHLGISSEFTATTPDNTRAVLKDLNIEQPYLLTVGTLEPRKNIPFAIDIFEKLTEFDGHLVIAGMPGWKYGPILKRIRNSTRAKDIHYIEYVPDSQLPALYTGAELFVFTSFYEGFGFPPLEAMACGTPVVSSTGGSLAEVLENGAEIINSFEIEQWLAALRKLLSDSECRETRIAAGRRQAAKYSWANTAENTWEVYRELAK